MGLVITTHHPIQRFIVNCVTHTIWGDLGVYRQKRGGVRWEELVRIDGRLIINKGGRVREVSTEGSAGGADGRTMMPDDGIGSNASPLSNIVRVQR
jgi:hypothetical protein